MSYENRVHADVCNLKHTYSGLECLGFSLLWCFSFFFFISPFFFFRFSVGYRSFRNSSFYANFLKCQQGWGGFFVLFCLIDSRGTCGTGARILFKRMGVWRLKKTHAAIRRLLPLIGDVTQVGDSGFHLSHSLLSCLIPRTIPVRNTLWKRLH